MKVIKANKRGFSLKYPLLAGNQSLKIENPSILENKNKGRIVYRFKTKKSTGKYLVMVSNKVVGSIYNSQLEVPYWMDLGLIFHVKDGTTSNNVLLMRVLGMSRDYFIDGEWHTVEVVIELWFD